MSSFSRRSFLTQTAFGAGSALLGSSLLAEEQVIQGFDETETNIDQNQEWKPFSDRKLRVGIAGFGVCQFGAVFSFQNHPNVDVVAVTDLFPDRCEGLAMACGCKTTYPSLEEMIKDDNIEAVFIATDAPHHAEHAIMALNAGKHVACAVPAVYGSLEDAEKLYETVKKTGLHYGLFETSAYHDDVYASRKIYKNGGFGRIIYTEGEYLHYEGARIEGYKDWRIGLPPMWYPTHAVAYYTCITGKGFTEVSCMGNRSELPEFENNAYGNRMGTETALFRNSEEGMARMIVSWDSLGPGAEAGRNRGEHGSYYRDYRTNRSDLERKMAMLNLLKPALPPNVDAGGHGGSHGYLMANFVESVIMNRAPLVNVAVALNTTVPGIVAHMSAQKDGELMKIPQFELQCPFGEE